MLLQTVALVACVLISSFGGNDGYKVEMIYERSVLGEGPYWDGEQQRLYWVDMRNMWINSYSPDTGHISKARLDTTKTPVTFVIRVKDTADKFVIGIKGTLALIQWDGISNVTVTPKEFLNLESPTSKSRCNDAKVDPAGRLWVGTMGAQTKSDPNGNEFEKDKGNVYVIDHFGIKRKMIDKMQIPNGLDWSLNKKTFYLVDSLTFSVYEYDYNVRTHEIARRRVVYDLKANGIAGGPHQPNTLPDGMTIDKDGMLWVAVYGTGKVIKINPRTGQKIFEIQLDKVLQPTSVTFGGKNLDILFVTSARVDWTEEFEQKYPMSGYTFKITNLGVRGAGPSRPASLPHATVASCCHGNQKG